MLNITVIMGENGAGKTTYLKKEILQYKRLKIGYLPQEVALIFNPIKSIYSQLIEVKTDKVLSEYLAYFNLNHLQDRLHSYPHEFSLGELQRLALICIFMRKDIEVIFLDEPTAFLDEENKQCLLLYLQRLSYKVFLSTHDIKFAKALTSNIHFLSEVDINYNVDFNLKNYEASQENLYEISHFKNILILGNSGFGKTFLAKDLFNYLSKKKQKVGFLLQNYASALPPHITIKSILLEAFYFNKVNKGQGTLRAYREFIKIFKRFNLSKEVLKKLPASLSLGEKQKILIVRQVLLDVKIIIFDEPSSSLDKKSEGFLLEFLLQIQKTSDLRFIIVSHSQHLAQKLAEKQALDYIVHFSQAKKYSVYKKLSE